METSLILRSLASCLKVAVSVGASGGIMVEPASRRRRWAGTRPRAARSSFREYKLSAFSLGAVLLGGMALSPLQAQTAYFAGGVTTLGGGFETPFGVAVDGSGNVYVVDNVFDQVNSGVKKIPPGCISSSCVTTLGGGFETPFGVAVDGSGNVYVSDPGNNAVKEVPPGCTAANYTSNLCTVTTLGGGFETPFGVAVDGSGNVYVADGGDGAVKEMPPGCTTANYTSNLCTVTTLGGGFNGPEGVAVDGSGNVYVADTPNNAVMEMPPGCTSSNFSSGNCAITTLGGGFNMPQGVAVDRSGNVYVADSYNYAVKEMPPGCTSANHASSVCTIRTLGQAGYTAGGVAVDGSGNVYAAYPNFNAVEEIMPHGVNFGTVAVGTTGPALTLYFTFTAGGSGITASALTQGAKGLDFADVDTGTCDTNGSSYTYTAGASCTVNVTFAPKYAGARYGAVELLNGSGSVIAAPYIYGTGQGPELTFQPGSQSTVASEIGYPDGVAVDGSGNVYFTNSGQPYQLVRSTPSNGSYAQSVLPTTALSDPYGVAVDGAGNVYVADSGNFRVLKETVTASGYAESTVASFPAVGGSAPVGVAVDGAGNVYVSLGVEAGIVYKESLTASGYAQSTVVSGLPADAGIAVDGSGIVYVAVNLTNGWIVKATPSASGYTQSTIPVIGYGVPFAVAVDADGSVYVAFTDNSDVGQVFKETPENGSYTQSTMPTSGLNQPQGVALDGAGNVYVANYGGNGIVKEILAVSPSLSFAVATLGSTSSDSPQKVTLSNIGNAALAFPIPGPGENPSVSANFALDSSTTCPEVLSSSSAGSLAAGASCDLAVDFIPATTGTITGAVVLTDNNLNANPAVTQSIGLSGTGIGTPITPYTEVNNGPWQTTNSATVNYDGSVSLGPQVGISGGSWSWSGPGVSGSTSREIDNVSLPSGTNTFIATYTNPAGVQSTETFTITIAPTTINPYTEVNNGVWQTTNTATVSPGSAVNLGPQVGISGGTWNWSGPGVSGSTSREIDNVSLPSGTNTFIATYTNPAGVQSTETFTIAIAPTAITPYLEANNNGVWQTTNSITVNYGSAVSLGPQVGISGGTWSWSGPGVSGSTSREIDNVSLPSGTNTFIATYTNPAGVTSTETFTITVNPTMINPYTEVNNGPWQTTNTATVSPGSAVSLGPQVGISGGSWSWSGPGVSGSTSREIDNVSLPSGTNTFIATYTNPAGVTSTETFTITVNPTTINPYTEVNNGPWQVTNSATVNYGSAVNLGPQVGISGGSWSWSGPGVSGSTSREIDNVSLPSGTNTFIATYTNPAGVTSAETFTIMVNPTTITPYTEVNNGPWQVTNSVTVSLGSTVSLGPQPVSGGMWSWSGPNGFNPTSREIDNIPLSLGTNTYVATYTNASGVQSVETFTVLVIPQSAISVSSIQTLSSWIAATDSESGGGGGAMGTMKLVSSPSYGGSEALQFVTNFTDFGDERYSTVFGDDTSATNFIWDGWVYLDQSVSDIANLEMDMNQVLANGQTVIYGFQCDGYSGTWDYTINAGTPQSPVDEWVHSSAPCNVRNWSTETWHHVQVQYSRDNSGNVTYSSVWLDGVQSQINATVPSAFALGWGQVLLTNFEVDGLGASGSSTMYLGDLTVYRW